MIMEIVKTLDGVNTAHPCDPAAVRAAAAALEAATAHNGQVEAFQFSAIAAALRRSGADTPWARASAIRDWARSGVAHGRAAAADAERLYSALGSVIAAACAVASGAQRNPASSSQVKAAGKRFYDNINADAVSVCTLFKDMINDLAAADPTAPPADRNDDAEAPQRRWLAAQAAVDTCTALQCMVQRGVGPDVTPAADTAVAAAETGLYERVCEEFLAALAAAAAPGGGGRARGVAARLSDAFIDFNFELDSARNALQSNPPLDPRAVVLARALMAGPAACRALAAVLASFVCTHREEARPFKYHQPGPPTVREIAALPRGRQEALLAALRRRVPRFCVRLGLPRVALEADGSARALDASCLPALLACARSSAQILAFEGGRDLKGIDRALLLVLWESCVTLACLHPEPERLDRLFYSVAWPLAIADEDEAAAFVTAAWPSLLAFTSGLLRHAPDLLASGDALASDWAETMSEAVLVEALSRGALLINSGLQPPHSPHEQSKDWALLASLLAAPNAARTFAIVEAVVRDPSQITPWCKHGLLRCASPMDMHALALVHSDARASRAALHMLVTEGKYLMVATEAIIKALTQPESDGGDAESDGFREALHDAAREDPMTTLHTTMTIAVHVGSEASHWFSRGVAWTDATLLAAALRGAGVGEAAAAGAAALSEEEVASAPGRAAGLPLLQRAELLETALINIKGDYFRNFLDVPGRGAQTLAPALEGISAGVTAQRAAREARRARRAAARAAADAAAADAVAEADAEATAAAATEGAASPRGGGGGGGGGEQSGAAAAAVADVGIEGLAATTLQLACRAAGYLAAVAPPLISVAMQLSDAHGPLMGCAMEIEARMRYCARWALACAPQIAPLLPPGLAGRLHALAVEENSSQGPLEEDGYLETCRIVGQSALPRFGGAACGNPLCDNVVGAGESELKLQKCGRCGAVSYCGRDCQKAHFKAGHKDVCRAAPAPA